MKKKKYQHRYQTGVFVRTMALKDPRRTAHHPRRICQPTQRSRYQTEKKAGELVARNFARKWQRTSITLRMRRREPHRYQTEKMEQETAVRISARSPAR